MKNIHLISCGLYLLITTACSMNEDDVDYNTTFAQAIEYFNLGKDDSALLYTNRAINVQNTASAWSLKGRVFYALKEPDSALYAFNYAINLDSSFIDAYNYRAAIHSLQQNYPEAISDMNKIIREDPTNRELILRKAAYFLRAEELDSAFYHFNQGIELDSLDSRNYLYAAVCLRKMKKLDEAMTQLRMADQLKPMDPVIKEELGFAYLEKGEYQKSIQAFSFVISEYAKQGKTGDVYAFNLNNLGHAYTKAKEYDTAEYYIDESIKLNPSNAYAFRNKGLLNLARNRTENACVDFYKSKELGFEEKFGEEINELISVHCQGFIEN